MLSIRKLYYKLPFILLLTSCMIAINVNEYRYLTPKEKESFQPFSMNALSKSHDKKDSLIIYEITSQDIRQITKQHKYTWIHFWAPYCKNKICTSTVYYMCNLREEKKDHDIATILVSTIYSLKDIKNSFSGSGSDCGVFVLSNAYYGEKQERGLKKFASEIDNNSLIKKNKYFPDYFFKDTLLVKASWGLTEAEIDSLLSK